jgi:hypothetical protein
VFGCGRMVRIFCTPRCSGRIGLRPNQYPFLFMYLHHKICSYLFLLIQRNNYIAVYCSKFDSDWLKMTHKEFIWVNIVTHTRCNLIFILESVWVKLGVLERWSVGIPGYATRA